MRYKDWRALSAQARLFTPRAQAGYSSFKTDPPVLVLSAFLAREEASDIDEKCREDRSFYFARWEGYAGRFGSLRPYAERCLKVVAMAKTEQEQAMPELLRGLLGA